MELSEQKMMNLSTQEHTLRKSLNTLRPSRLSKVVTQVKKPEQVRLYTKAAILLALL
jgi:hypothetical protein